jgi:hypothetical protein
MIYMFLAYKYINVALCMCVIHKRFDIVVTYLV